MAKLQMQTYLTNQSAYESSRAGDYALLTALSDGAGLYASADENNNQGPNAGPAGYPAANRYGDATAATLFAEQGRTVFARVLASRPHRTRDLSGLVRKFAHVFGLVSGGEGGGLGGVGFGE